MSDANHKPAARDEIEKRAYEIYLARGGQDGQDIADWVTAERELNESEQEPISISATDPQSSGQSTDIAAQEPQKESRQKILQDVGGKKKAVAASQQSV